MKDQRGPKPGAAQRLRDAYWKITKRPLAPEVREKLEEAFRKQDRASESIPKKIAKSDRDVEL